MNNKRKNYQALSDAVKSDFSEKNVENNYEQLS